MPVFAHSEISADSATNQNRNDCLRKNPICHAAKQQLRHSAVSLGGYDNEIAGPVLSRRYNAHIRAVVFDPYGVASDSSSSCGVRDASQCLDGVLSDVLGELRIGWQVSDARLRNIADIERCIHNERGYLRAN